MDIQVHIGLMKAKIDDRQITHLVCVRLKHLQNDFFRACFGPFI